MSRLAGRTADNNVGNSAALGPGEPSGDERVARRKLAIDPHRPPRQEHRYGRDAIGLIASKQLQPGFVAQNKILPIARKFSVRLLPKYHDRGVRAGLVRAIARQDRLPLAGHRCGDPGVDAGCAGEIGVGEVAAALPADRPSAGLARDAVSARPGDEHRCRRAQRQHPVILEQHQRFAHRFARQRPMRRSAKRRELATQRAR